MLFRKRMITLNEAERDGMRTAGRFNAQLLDHLRTQIQPGITTGEIDKIILEYTYDHGHKPATMGYKVGNNLYNHACCTSVNDVICHGIPNKKQVLRDGDIVNVDCTTVVNGWHGDSSETFLIGECSQEARDLCTVTLRCLYAGIESIRPGGRISDIGAAIVSIARPLGYSVVREYVGHGLGRKFHQEPSVPHYPSPQATERIPAGVCFTVEPMINQGTRDTKLDKKDGWTVRTKDGKLSAQFEHSILVTEQGPEILTLTKNGPQPRHVF